MQEWFQNVSMPAIMGFVNTKPFARAVDNAAYEAE